MTRKRKADSHSVEINFLKFLSANNLHWKKWFYIIILVLIVIHHKRKNSSRLILKYNINTKIIFYSLQTTKKCGFIFYTTYL